MTFQNPERPKIKKLLEQTKTIAVVGCSDNPERTSHMVAKALQNKGYRVIPVNPNADHILGEKCYSQLTDIAEAVDIVDVFRRSEFVMPIARQAVEIGAKVLWLQSGIVHEEAAQYAQQHGLTVVMDRCLKVEDSLLIPKKG